MNENTETTIDALDVILEESDESFSEAVESYRQEVEQEVREYFGRHEYSPVEPFNSRLYSASAVLDKLTNPDFKLPHEYSGDPVFDDPVRVALYGTLGAIPYEMTGHVDPNGLRILERFLDSIRSRIIQGNEQLKPLEGEQKEAYEDMLSHYRPLLENLGIRFDPITGVFVRSVASILTRYLFMDERSDSQDLNDKT